MSFPSTATLDFHSFPEFIGKIAVWLQFEGGSLVWPNNRLITESLYEYVRINNHRHAVVQLCSRVYSGPLSTFPRFRTPLNFTLIIESLPPDISGNYSCPISPISMPCSNCAVGHNNVEIGRHDICPSNNFLSSNNFCIYQTKIFIAFMVSRLVNNSKEPSLKNVDGLNSRIIRMLRNWEKDKLVTFSGRLVVQWLIDCCD